MPVKIDTMFEGEWPSVAKAVRWLKRSSLVALEGALREEIKHLTLALKRELRSGGSPAFKPLSPFTVAIRKAMGLRGQKPLIASRQLLGLIRHKRVGKLSYFAGVIKGTPYKKEGGATTDATEIAMYVEMGRGPVILKLDKISPRTGKTPRQWLWWLYFQGALNAPPSRNKNFLFLRASEARPFVKQTWDRESKQSAERIKAAWIAAFERSGGSGASRLFDWNAVTNGSPWED